MEKKILVAGYPKSGNTWLNWMLSYLLGAKYFNLDEPQKYPKNGKLAQLTGHEGPPKYTSSFSQVTKTHALPNEITDLESYRIIHLIRDPRDISVSLYYYRKNRQAKSGFKEVEDNLKINKTLFSKTLIQVCNEWKRHYLAWKPYSDPKSQISYEELVSNPYNALNKILLYLGEEVSSERLADCVETFSFDNVTLMLEGEKRKNGKEKKNSFFRKGVAGDHVNYFSFRDRLILRVLSGKICKQLGYNLSDSPS